MSSWHLLPGQSIDRAELHARYGGRIQGRISPSKQSLNIFLFLTPNTPSACFDGWTGEHMHFGGEGGLGGADQTLTQGNRAVQRHEEEGRALRLFLQSRPDDPVRYLGQYRLDPDVPFVRADAAPDPRRPHEMRSCLVFRLLALDGPPAGVPVVMPATHEREMRRVEPGAAPGSVLRATDDPGQRTAARLLRDFTAYARYKRLSELTGYRIRVPQTITDLSVDLFDLTHNELIVIRPTTARPVVWTALGELYDLARFFDPEPRRVLLLPSRPSDDVIGLLLTERVAVVWPTPPGEFTRMDLAP